MLERLFFHPNGRMRTRRMLGTVVILLAFALFGSLLAVVSPAWSGLPQMQLVWTTFAIFALKLPLIGLCAWLIMRNKELPGRPVRWSDSEASEIITYLSAEARRALEEPDVEARLSYLSREAWHVADRAEGVHKADAVGVALEIDRLLSRCRGPRRG